MIFNLREDIEENRHALENRDTRWERKINLK